MHKQKITCDSYLLSSQPTTMVPTSRNGLQNLFKTREINQIDAMILSKHENITEYEA